MLTVKVLGEENFDQETQEFIYPEAFELHFEHSLVALSKWEAFYEKPFLGPEVRSPEEARYYIYCMSLRPVTFEALDMLTESNVIAINEYVNAKMTATWFTENANAPRATEVITNELIYYWMNAFTIPIACENWHLGRLFTLLRIHSLKSEKPKKMGKSDAAQQQRELNAKRRQQLGTSG